MKERSKEDLDEMRQQYQAVVAEKEKLQNQLEREKKEWDEAHTAIIEQLQAEAVQTQNETNSMKQSASNKDKEIDGLKKEMNGMAMKFEQIEDKARESELEMKRMKEEHEKKLKERLIEENRLETIIGHKVERQDGVNDNEIITIQTAHSRQETELKNMQSELSTPQRTTTTTKNSKNRRRDSKILPNTEMSVNEKQKEMLQTKSMHQQKLKEKNEMTPLLMQTPRNLTADELEQFCKSFSKHYLKSN